MKRRLAFLMVFVLLSILAGCGRFEDLGGTYKLQCDPNSYVVVSDTMNRIIVRGHVVKATSNSGFILLKQIPIDSICECNIECFQKMNSYDKRSYRRCKEAIQRRRDQLFWIIDKTQDLSFNPETKTYSNVFGPYREEEYRSKRIELNVPDELVLEDE